jgi:phage terminase small subunit
MPLTPKQQRFVEEYLVDLNATQAAIRAGYSEATAKQQGSRLLTYADIAEAIEKATEKRSEETKIDAAWVLQKAKELHEKALEAESYAAAKGALDLIGKHIDVQAFREQMQHSGRVEYVNMTDEEIEARIAAIQSGKDDRPSIIIH